MYRNVRLGINCKEEEAKIEVDPVIGSPDNH